MAIKPTTESTQNIFGAKWAYAGLEATFSMEDLDEIRAASKDKEFLITIVGEKKHSNRDFLIKEKLFQKMGD